MVLQRAPWFYGAAGTLPAIWSPHRCRQWPAVLRAPRPVPVRVCNILEFFFCLLSHAPTAVVAICTCSTPPVWWSLAATSAFKDHDMLLCSSIESSNIDETSQEKTSCREKFYVEKRRVDYMAETAFEPDQESRTIADEIELLRLKLCLKRHTTQSRASCPNLRLPRAGTVCAGQSRADRSGQSWNTDTF